MLLNNVVEARHQLWLNTEINADDSVYSEKVGVWLVVCGSGELPAKKQHYATSLQPVHQTKESTSW